MTEPTVSIQPLAAYDDLALVQQAVRAALEPLGGMAAFVHPGARVLLKPNYIMALPAAAAATTHPAVIWAVAREVMAAGGAPVIGDSPAFGKARAAARVSGLLDLPGGRSLEVIEFNRAVRVAAAPPGPCHAFTFGFDPRAVDLIVNLPKLKVHGQLVISLALKNHFGCVKGRHKAWLHFAMTQRSRNRQRDFHRMLVQCYATLRPTLSILDGVIALSRRGPTGGVPVKVGALVAAVDAVALDRVACEIVSVDPARVLLLQVAREMSAGETDLDRIAIAGPAPRALNVAPIELQAEPVPIRFQLRRIVRGFIRDLIARWKQA